jgi:hypothetical protein
MGWDEVASAVHRGLNAEAEESTVIYARRVTEKDNTGTALAVTLMLHRLDDGEWTPEELDPVAELVPIPWTASGQPCGLEVRMKYGSEYLVDFADIEGRATT